MHHRDGKLKRAERRAAPGLTSLTVVSLVSACGGGTGGDAVEDAPVTEEPVSAPSITASNAFYYYEDVDAAWRFYTEVLGFETTADYGFAKIMRAAPSSYLTLVDAAAGMHSADEPKTATLALVTEQVEGWHDYLTGRGVPMRADFDVVEGRPHDGFVAIDPEDYLLEFERFNPHPENERLHPALGRIEPLFPAADAVTDRPADLGIQATVLWLYYRDIPAAQRFYENVLGLEMMVDQGWAKVYPTSRTGFLGLVDGERGLHQATEEKGVTVSFFVDDVESWFAHVGAHEDFELRTPEITDESERVAVFVGYDPEGYFLEWDTFLDVDGNEELVEQLRSESLAGQR